MECSSLLSLMSRPKTSQSVVSRMRVVRALPIKPLTPRISTFIAWFSLLGTVDEDGRLRSFVHKFLFRVAVNGGEGSGGNLLFPFNLEGLDLQQSRAGPHQQRFCGYDPPWFP